MGILKKKSEIRYMTSLLTFYITGKISWDMNMVYCKIPNIILGFLPFGSRNQSIPVQHITNASVNSRLVTRKLFFALLFGGLAWYCFMKHPGESLYLVGGVILAICAFGKLEESVKTSLVLTMASGQVFFVEALFLEGGKLRYAQKQINELLAGRMYDTNVRVHIGQQTMMQQQLMAQQTNALLGGMAQYSAANGNLQQPYGQGVPQVPYNGQIPQAPGIQNVPQIPPTMQPQMQGNYYQQGMQSQMPLDGPQGIDNKDEI